MLAALALTCTSSCSHSCRRTTSDGYRADCSAGVCLRVCRNKTLRQHLRAGDLSPCSTKPARMRFRHTYRHRQADRQPYVQYTYLHAPFMQPEAAWTSSATTGTGEPCSCDVVCGLRISEACCREQEEEKRRMEFIRNLKGARRFLTRRDQRTIAQRKLLLL